MPRLIVTPLILALVLTLPAFFAHNVAAQSQKDAFQRCADLYSRYGMMKQYKECLEKAQGMSSLDHQGGMSIGGAHKPYDPDDDDDLKSSRNLRKNDPPPGGGGGSDPSCTRKGGKICKGL